MNSVDEEDEKSALESKREARVIKTEHLKPFQWQPGESGNPGGRPANPFKSEIFKQLEGAARVEFIKGFVQKALDGDERAARLLLEYSVGKPGLQQEDREALERSGGGLDALAVLFGVRK